MQHTYCRNHGTVGVTHTHEQYIHWRMRSETPGNKMHEKENKKQQQSCLYQKARVSRCHHFLQVGWRGGSLLGPNAEDDGVLVQKV